MEAFAEWAEALFDHYLNLLRSDGQSYSSLVKNCYQTKEPYLPVLNRIIKSESRFYKALRTNLNSGTGEVNDVIKTMETSPGVLRKEEARALFG